MLLNLCCWNLHVKYCDVCPTYDASLCLQLNRFITIILMVLIYVCGIRKFRFMQLKKNNLS